MTNPIIKLIISNQKIPNPMIPNPLLSASSPIISNIKPQTQVKNTISTKINPNPITNGLLSVPTPLIYSTSNYPTYLIIGSLSIGVFF